MNDYSSLISEEHLLSSIDKYFPKRFTTNIVGRGDDCAVFNTASSLCISTDLFIENIHFRCEYFTPEDIGWKALAVNLSDIAACGAQPIGFSIGLALPSYTSIDILEGIYAGMSHLAKQFNLPLLGGDLSQAPQLSICITVLGETDNPLLRAQSQPGDVIFIIGEIGLACTGLQLLEQEGTKAIELYPKSCMAHLRPFPLIHEGLSLSKMVKNWSQQTIKPSRLALMDNSDGLAQDLPRLLGKGKGADITIPSLDYEIIQFIHSSYTKNKYSPEIHAFIGGEDYNLIGTCSPSFGSMLQAVIPNIHIIGYVTDSDTILCHGKNLQGFDHFRKNHNLTCNKPYLSHA